MSFGVIGQPAEKIVDVLNFFLKPLPVPKELKYFIKAISRKIIDYLEFKSYGFLNKVPEKVSFKNCEDLEDFNFTLPLLSEKEGISAFIRAKNEEDKIYACLMSIIDVFDEIIFADNQSDDETVKIVEKFKKDHDTNNKIKLISYPFKLARCGSEHKETPENSVSNLAYYYNYTLSHCTCRYVLKWDADMIFKPDQVSAFRRFVERISDLKGNGIWDIYGQNLYKDEKNNFWLSCEEIYREPRIFSLSYFNLYVKGRYFEILKSPNLNLQFNLFGWLLKREALLRRQYFPGVAYYELKFFDKDEFSHWTSGEVSHTLRKRKEIKAFEAIDSGEIYTNEAYTLVEESSMPCYEHFIA